MVEQAARVTLGKVEGWSRLARTLARRRTCAFRRTVRLEGHTDAVSALVVCHGRIVSGSWDGSMRVWDVESGDCLQVLEGHTDEIFSAAFNYEGDTIITGSKDNTCRIWKC